MAFKIISEEEPLPVENIIVVIFGMPGVAKTSLAFTAANPLLMDFDEGVHRSVGRKKVVKFHNWDDVREFTNSGEIERLEIKTLVADTAGAMLDEFIALAAIKQDQRNGKKGGGVSLQGFGAVKEIFHQFTVELRRKKIDLVVIAHAAEHKDGDNVKLRPKLTGGSYDILLAKADLVGYMETWNDKATLEFTPTDRHVGKNCAEFPKLELPHYSDPQWPGYLDRLIQQTKAKMMEMSEAQRTALESMREFEEMLAGVSDFAGIAEMEERLNSIAPIYKLQLFDKLNERHCAVWKEQFIDSAHTLEDFNALVERSDQLPKDYQKAVKTALLAAGREAGLAFRKELKQFEGEIKPSAVAPAPQQANAPAAEEKAPDPPKNAKKEPSEPAPAEQEPAPAKEEPDPLPNRNPEARKKAEAVSGVQTASKMPPLPKLPRQEDSTANMQPPGDLFPNPSKNQRP